MAHPAHLDDYLAAHGYRSVARTAVQTVDLATVLTCTPPLHTQPSFAIEVAETFDEAWFAAYCQFEGISGHEARARQSILQRIEAQVGFTLLQIDNRPVAVGLGVLAESWLGLFCMATDPAVRRRGTAAAIVRTLTIWAQLYAARYAYLQVMQDNAPALALYAKLGFTTHYHYHYRENKIL